MANFFKDDSTANGYDDRFAVWGETITNDNPFTDVGAYTDADSPYGTFDQNGNVWEWNETPISSSRGLRGGFWAGGEVLLRSSWRDSGGPSNEDLSFGFRVASPVPEPTSLALIALGVPLILRRRRG